MLQVAVAGATGWAGRAIAEGVLAADDLNLAGAIARSTAGSELGRAWGADLVGVMVAGQVGDALTGVDVLVDYTESPAAKSHALLAVERGAHVVIGTSGLAAEDFEEIDRAARGAGVGVVAAGNFSLTAAMAQAAALLAARFLPQREIIDYASAGKPDAPSGTARELAERLATVSTHDHVVPVGDTLGHPEARGAQIAGT